MPAGIEIERKFLVEHIPTDLASHPCDEIEQGYLAITGEGLEVRVRRYGRHRYLTIKSGAGRLRVEEEIEIDERRFGSLWPLTDGRRIQKRRYLIPAEDGRRIELDLYEGPLAGLVTAELEFDSPAAAEAFVPPAWFGRDVTDDPRYKNRQLAVDGLPV